MLVLLDFHGIIVTLVLVISIKSDILYVGPTFVSHLLGQHTLAVVFSRNKYAVSE